MKSFLLILVLLCFSPPSYSQDVNRRWLHILDARHMSGQGRGCRSLVTCQRGLDTRVEWQASTSILTPGLTLAKLYSQLASSILMLLLILAKLYSRLASSILLGLAEPAHQVQAHWQQPPLPRILSSFLANNIWTPSGTEQPSTLASSWSMALGCIYKLTSYYASSNYGIAMPYGDRSSKAGSAWL